MNAKRKAPETKSEVIKEGSVSVTIYTTRNRIYRTSLESGRKELKSEHPQYTLVYYSGNRRIKRKFTELQDARAEAQLVVTKLANGETEALKLTGADRISYVHARQRLREWRTDADLNLVVADYVAAAKRLPDGVMLKECVDFWLKRHSASVSKKTVAEAVAELIKSKTDAGKSDIYVKDLKGRLNHFANTFQVPIASVTGAEIEEYLRGLRRSGRTQNNHRRIIGTLFKFATRRGYFATSLVALLSQSLSAARRMISIAANHFGAFGAGSPNGINLRAASKIGMSCSANPRSFAVCFNRTKD